MDTCSRVQELSDSEVEDLSSKMADFNIWPPWLLHSHIGTLTEELQTKTLEAQLRTQAECMPYLMLDDLQGFTSNEHGLPQLDRAGHIRFLHKVFEGMPAPYQAMDAARPWFFYWALQGLTVLGEDVSCYRERLMRTLGPLQNATGGFAGGHGQQSHLATSYGCVLALAMVDGLEMVDRRSMWHFISQVKQADGGFKVAIMAEEDIRGAYCAMTIVTLLNLPLDLSPDAPARTAGLKSFVDGLGKWIGRCQTYEGGIGGAPTNEAHGAYAFCALACLSILDSPQVSIPQYLDVTALIRWLADRQTSPEGGFAGRTNKLVDACYSHWVGACWALLGAATQRQHNSPPLWNRQGLIRYLLTCCQQPKRGGMRDKPSTRPDAYHTCYSLAGLSAAEHHHEFDQGTFRLDSSRRCKAPFHWRTHAPSKQEMRSWSIGPTDLIRPVHPVLVIPYAVVDAVRLQFKDDDIEP